MKKIDLITELYRRTLKELTSSKRAWMDFLKTSAFQYKYLFADQVLIHAQRPGAVACAELELWNKQFGRWVNKGAHGIALIREQGGKAVLTHVFDVNDTHHIDDIPFKLWEARREMRRDIAESLENSFGHLQMKATIADAAICACENICEDNYPDYLAELMSSASGSRLDEYDEDNMRVRLLSLLKFSTAYSVLSRLGFRGEESLDVDELDLLVEFNTPEVINILGSATSDITEICLRDIERTVKAYEKEKNRTFEENNDVVYNETETIILDKGEKEHEYGSDVELQRAGRSDDTRPEAAESDRLSSRQIRTDEARIPEEAPKGDLHDAFDRGEAERASSRDGDYGKGADLEDYIPDGTEPWDNGAYESDRADEVGSDDERAETFGGGRGNKESDLRITDETSQPLEEDEDELPIPDEDSIILAIRHGDNLQRSKEEIVSFLLSEKDYKKKGEYVKNSYKPDAAAQILRPGEREYVGYRASPLGFYIYEGSNSSLKSEVSFSWRLVAEFIEALARENKYLDKSTPELKKPLALSQEIIDDFLRVGGCTRNSPERIYGYYRRASDKEENIIFLRNEYETDNVGLIINGKKYAASWNEEGLRISEGIKAEGVWKSVLLSWEEVEKRIRELIELGQYLPKERAELADGIFMDFVTERLSSLYYYNGAFANIPKEYVSVGRFNGFTDYENEFKKLLSDTEKAGELYNEIKENEKRLGEYPPNIRYRDSWRPPFVGLLTKQFTKEPISFKEADPNILPKPMFVTEERITNSLIDGSNVYDGKYRIYSHYLKERETDKRIAFLKHEYGTGGSSSSRYDETHDGKGLCISYGSMMEKNRVLLSWFEVAKRIDTLIRQDKYLSEEEILGLDNYEKRQVARAIQNFYREKDADIPRPFTYDKSDLFYEKTDEIVSKLDNPERAAEIYSMMREVFESEMPGSRNYEYNRNSLDIVKQFSDGTYDLFPNSHFRKKKQPPISEEAKENTHREETAEEEIKTETEDINLKESGYNIGLGSWLHIGTSEVMLQSATKDGVSLFDGTLFPIEMPYEVFLERLRENPLNDNLLIEKKEKVTPAVTASKKDEAKKTRQKKGDEPTVESVAEVLLERYERWDQLLNEGGSDPFYTDGENMSLIRNHIIFYRKELEKMCVDGNYPEIYHRGVPDEMPRSYMAQADKIREDAKRSLEVYKADPTYKWCKANLHRIPEKELQKTTILNIMGYVSGLESFIEKDSLVDMRRHRDPERYMDSFETCRKQMEKIFERVSTDELTDKLFDSYMNGEDEDVEEATELEEKEKTTVKEESKPLSMFEKYELLKENHPGYILVVRVGDFYEFFDESAKVASEKLGIMLTSRSFPDGNRYPMCGVPFHKKAEYFQKLLDEGFRIAVYDENGEGLAEPSESINEKLLSEAKKYIFDYYEKEFREPIESFESILRIPLAHTTVGDNEEHEIQVYSDLVNYDLISEIDGIEVERLHYDSLREYIDDVLKLLDFDSLVYLSDLDGRIKYAEGKIADREAEKSIDAHEREFGADGTRTFAEPELSDEELDELPVSTVIDGKVETFKNSSDMLDALNTSMPTLKEEKPVLKKANTVFHPEIDIEDRIDHSINAEDLPLRVPSDKYERNVRAIRLLRKLEDENRLATASEQKLLADYSGWGGLADRFDEKHSDYEELKELLTPEEYSAARESTLTAFYTPPVIIEAIYKALENMGFSRGNILEPSCGVGNFIGFLPEGMKESKVYGVELDSLSGRMAQQLYQKQNITIGGFEDTVFPDSFFDVAIGNVPFGQFKVVDKKYDKYNFLIHDYFFAKALDKVRPGGVVAFITSKGTMDKENSSVRKYIAERAELLGAIRLPDNAFKSAGTEVVSDIIFLQKRDRVIETEADWVHLGKDENGITMNSYFVNNPDMILGEVVMRSGPFGPEPTCKAYEGQDLKELLEEAISNIHAEITAVENQELDEDTNTVPADPNVKNFSYTLVDGKVYFRQNSIMKKVETTVTGENRIKGMIEIRDIVRALIDAQLEGYSDSAVKEIQKELNTKYDAFTKKYGLINSRANESVFSDDSSYFLLSSLEILNEDKELERKADMFYKRTINPFVTIERVDTSSEALAVSLSEKAGIDMEYMSALTGKSDSEIYEELKGVIFLNPEESSFNNQPKYLTADEYLSGNVREKLERAKKLVENDFHEYSVNVEALEAVQPEDLTAAEIGVKLGSTWVPDEIVEEFVFDLLGTPHWVKWNMSVKYVPQTATWVISNKTSDRTNVKANTVYGTSRINAYEIIEQTLNLKDVRIFDYFEGDNGKPTAVLNKKETTIAQGKQEEIKRAFEDWIWQDPERRERLCKLYNEKFNSLRPREYDGSHIKFYGMNPEIRLRKHQANAVARIMYGGNSLLAHVVGAGKTFTMVAAAQEMKRLGLCNKSMFVVPNHLIEQWASEYLQLYPSANILVATKKDFETKNRKKFCARIATGDYDAVIIGHSQFEKIPVSIERQQRTLEHEIDELTASIMKLKYDRDEKITVKQLEKSKKSLEAKLKKLNDQTRKDNVVTFEELGIDRIFVDEAHFYKNLFVYTKMRNVAGIAQTEAQKSSDLYMKCRYLDEITGSRGVIFATGTPVSNTMVELYTMQRYLQYDELKKRGLSAFDSWASTFGETVSAIELAPDGSGYRSKTRFAKFYNIPELMSMFKQVADIQTADMLNLPVPRANYQIVKVPASEIQKKMVESFAERAEKIHNKEVSSDVDNMLLVTNDGRKAALDQRLINPLLPDEAGSKVNTCVQNLFETWEENKDKRLTQMLFCDLSTPKGDGKFNVYDDIRDKLVKMGIPREEIAFIHTADTDAKKKELFGKVRSGQVRILMGSTFKMGAGTNVQRLLKRLHDLDAPWRPSDLEQRSGRIVRQGNLNEEVGITRYITEGTFDAYLYQLLETKQKFISQIMTSKTPVRSAEDVDETALSYAEIKALASGNPKIIEKMQLDADVAKLKLQRASHNSQRFMLEDRLRKYFPRNIKEAEGRINGLDADIKLAEANTHPNEKGFSGMEIMGVDYTEKAEAGKAILEICKNISSSKPREFGEYRGFKAELGFDEIEQQFYINLVGTLTHNVMLGNDANGIFTRLDNKIKDMENRLVNCCEELQNLYSQVENAKAELLKPFPREEELQEKQARLDVLNSELNMDKRENEFADEAPEEPEGEEKKEKSPSVSEEDLGEEEKGDTDREER